MYTLCFIHNKIMISCFYELLFLIFNVLLFSLVIFKLYTYHNSCLPSDLTKIRTSSKNNTKLRLLSKKLKSSKQFTFSSQIFITRRSEICYDWMFKWKISIEIYCKGSSIKYVRSKTPIFWSSHPSPCTHLYAFTFPLQFYFSCYQELMEPYQIYCICCYESSIRNFEKISK